MAADTDIQPSRAPLKATAAPATTQRHPFRREINLWSFSKKLSFSFFFKKSYPIIYENIISSVYVAVIDLFMKNSHCSQKCPKQPNRWTAIVLLI